MGARFLKTSILNLSSMARMVAFKRRIHTDTTHSRRVDKRPVVPVIMAGTTIYISCDFNAL